VIPGLIEIKKALANGVCQAITSREFGQRRMAGFVGGFLRSFYSTYAVPSPPHFFTL